MISSRKIEKLLILIEPLRSEIKDTIDNRLNEFKETGKKNSNEIFKELCFCILTANYRADKSIKIQKEIDNGFLTIAESNLAMKLKKLGHRYPNARANYITKARIYKDILKDIILSFEYNKNGLRDWLVKNIKGIGYKEASHFLRNIGYTDFAIIDFHIINVLAKYELIIRPKNLTCKRYFEIENLLKEIAKKIDLNLAELDLYLWYIETKKILK